MCPMQTPQLAVLVPHSDLIGCVFQWILLRVPVGLARNLMLVFCAFMWVLYVHCVICICMGFVFIPAGHMGQFMITLPSTSLIFSINTTLLAFSDQHLDLSLMFPGPGIPRQSGTASEPSDMSLPPSGMSSPRASRRRTPFSLSDLC